jgi:phage gp46-like protein
MPDIALVASNDPATGFPRFDIELTSVPDGAGEVARDVSLDAGLSTAVYISLFTDARASVEEGAEATDLRGWWGDDFGAFGSKLWLLTRGKVTDEAIAFARVSAEEALAWLVDGGIARSVSAIVTRIGLYAISISISIVRPEGTNSTFRYALNWAAFE